MRIELAVRDAVGQGVAATVEYLIQDPRGERRATVTLPGQRLPDGADDTFAVVLDVRHPEYIADLARVYRSPDAGSRWLSDNSCLAVAQSGSDLALTLTLGRIHAAPVEHVPDEQIATMRRDPTGVLLFRDNAGFVYHSLFNQEIRKFRLLADPVLDVGADPGQDWQRLKHRDVPIDPAGTGRFFHLEYGRSDTGPRLLVSVFLPGGQLPADALDFVVFYPPTTALRGRFPHTDYPFVRGYPYPLTGISQEYPRHAQAYLFNLKFLAYQLLAARKQAVLVLPVAAFGNVGPLQSQEGVARLLAELCQFLHRELFTTPLHNHRMVRTEYLRAGASVRATSTWGTGVRSGLLFGYPPVPRVGRVAIACFSSGAVPLHGVLTTKALDNRYPQQLFGVEQKAYQQAFGQAFDFRRSFQEVWDIDGAHAPYHGWAKFEHALAAWFREDAGRRFRLYHSSYTAGGRNPASAPDSALAPLTRTRTAVTRTARQQPGNVAVRAEELSDPGGRWSSLLFDNDYLLAESQASVAARMAAMATPDQWKPIFTWRGPDNNHAHQFLTQIALGHAAALSGLRSRP